jgi:hypothetical protein
VPGPYLSRPFHVGPRLRPLPVPDECEELRRLPDEQSVGGKGVDRADGGAFGLGGPDDRDDRELAIEEDRRLGHDQVGLCGLTVGVEVGEDQAVRRVGERRCVAGLVVPGLEVHRLGRPDAEQDPQHLGMGDPLSELGVETGASLLDEAKVEAGRIGDRLQVVTGAEVVVAARNRRELPGTEAGDCLREGVAKVGGFCESLR